MQSVRGMYDILPDQIDYWSCFVDISKEVLEPAGYREIRTPILESTALFLRCIGQGTDILNKEMYSFEDQGDRSLTLRPEGTASIARSIIQHNLLNNYPIQRFWYIGPMFRYERPQQGRQRQFHQLGIECVGSASPIADAEILYLAMSLLDKLKCPNYKLEINSIGDFQERANYKEKLTSYLLSYVDDLDTYEQKKLLTNPLKVFDSKSPQTQKILQHAPKITDFLSLASWKHFEIILEYLNSMNIQYIVNPNLVRGLDYYTKTTFEIKTCMLGAQDTICGGGRYDNLIEQLGGKHAPAVGWAIGVERLLLLLKNYLKIVERSIDYYIVADGEAARKYTLQLLPVLQAHDMKYRIELTDAKLSKQLKKAVKYSAVACIIIRDDEVQNQTVTIKWLNNYYQKTYSLAYFCSSCSIILHDYKK